MVVLPLRWWLVASHVVVLMLPLLALLGTGALGADLLSQTLATLHHQGAVVSLHVADELKEHGGPPRVALRDLAPELSVMLERIKWETLAGIRVVDEDGIVVAGSGGQEGVGEDLSGDPEVAEALRGISGTALKPRPAASQTRSLSSPSRRARVRVFHAVPIDINSTVVGAVVLSRTPREEMQALYQMGPRLWTGAGLAVFFTLLLGAGLSYLFSRSLKALSIASKGLAERPQDAGVLLESPQGSHVREVADVAVALEATADRLHDRLAYIAELAGNVSHEFKTPLSTLRGTVELLADDPDMPPEQRERFLGNAQREIDRLTTLVGGLLALARAEEVEGAERVDLGAMVREICGRHPRTVAEGSFGSVRGDGRQLTLVVNNLVSNAHRHGGEGVSVRVVGAVQAGRVRIEVIDDGLGISENNLERVFDRFFTTRRGEGGVGLGLALVGTIVRAHGGTVEVQSEPGRTCFSVDLPAATR